MVCCQVYTRPVGQCPGARVRVPEIGGDACDGPVGRLQEVTSTADPSGLQVRKRGLTGLLTEAMEHGARAHLKRLGEGRQVVASCEILVEPPLDTA